MLLSEAQAVVELKERTKNFEAVRPVEFLGQHYVLSLHFADDLLHQVDVTRDFDANLEECDGEFLRVYRAYRSTASELTMLSDRDLTDLGIHQADIHDLARHAAYGA